MKLKKLLIVAALLLGGTSVLARQGSAPGKRERESLPLAGIWQFKLDPTNVAIPVKGSRFTPQLPETITLPGSTDQAGKGYKTQDMTSIRLTRMFEYAGAAWYEKQNVFIPEEWRGKRIFIHLERAHWEVRAWVNGHAVGREMSLSTPHEFDITDRVKFGERNTVRFRVDNSKIFNLEYTHAVSARPRPTGTASSATWRSGPTIRSAWPTSSSIPTGRAEGEGRRHAGQPAETERRRRNRPALLGRERRERHGRAAAAADLCLLGKRFRVRREL